MKQLINIKELCKLIKTEGNRGMVIWSREQECHFITNRHVLVRFDALPREILVALFGIFLRIPEPGQTLRCQGGQVSNDVSPMKLDKVYEPSKQDNAGVTTSLLKDYGNKVFARVIKFPSHYAYVNEEYRKLDVSDMPPVTKGDSSFVPIYFAGGDLLILPYRTKNVDSDMDLLAAEQGPVGKE